MCEISSKIFLSNILFLGVVLDFPPQTCFTWGGHLRAVLHSGKYGISMPTVFSEIKMTQLPYLCLVFSVLYQPLTLQCTYCQLLLRKFTVQL